MGSRVDPPTLEVAIDCVRQHFVEPDGLLGQIEQGVGVEETEVQQIEVAFGVMRDTWKEKTLIPKEAVKLILHVSSSISTLNRCINRFPQHAEAIENLVYKVTDWTEGVFSLPSVLEENALTMVGQHLLGTRPFNLELLMGRINDDALGELLDALNILGQMWESRRQVSKFAAYAMVCAPLLFEGVRNDFRSEEQQRLQDTREQVVKSIIRCLS